MILSHYAGTDSSAFVYSLPGILPCCECSDGAFSGLMQNQGNIGNENRLSNPYPNPTTNSTKIDYTLPDSVNEGVIVFYNLQGMEVKRFKVDKTFSTLLVSTADIAAGTYLYQLQTSAVSTEGKKLIKIK